MHIFARSSSLGYIYPYSILICHFIIPDDVHSWWTTLLVITISAIIYITQGSLPYLWVSSLSTEIEKILVHVVYLRLCLFCEITIWANARWIHRSIKTFYFPFRVYEEHVSLWNTVLVNIIYGHSSASNKKITCLLYFKQCESEEVCAVSKNISFKWCNNFSQ